MTPGGPGLGGPLGKGPVAHFQHGVEIGHEHQGGFYGKAAAWETVSSTEVGVAPLSKAILLDLLDGRAVGQGIGEGQAHLYYVRAVLVQGLN